jgi:hypothetical protein
MPVDPRLHNVAMVLDIDTQNGDTKPLHTWPGWQRYTEHYRARPWSTPPLRPRSSHLDLTTHNPRSKEDRTLHNAISTLEGLPPEAGLGEGWGNGDSRVLLRVRDRTVALTKSSGNP